MLSRAMVDVSSRLRDARERAGLSIQDISARTKIKAVQLQAIERGEFERLPGAFFTRAFIKNYAREVGLPADELARDYDASRAERAPEARPAAELGRASKNPPVSVAHQQSSDARDASRRSVPMHEARSVWPPLALALILLIVISVVTRQPGQSGEPGVVGTAGTVEASAPVSPTPPVEKPPEVLTMEISPTALIWINAKVDGVQAVYRLVEAGEHLKIEARNELKFRIGNAAAFAYAINGVPGRTLGASGEVIEFQVTRDNVRTYRR